MENNMENNLEEDDTDLDIIWINEQTKLQNIQQNYFKEPMEQIKIYCIFINKNLYIDNINCQLHPVSVESNKHYTHLSQEHILKIIQTHKTNKSTVNYKLKEILSYIVDIEPGDIQQYVSAKNQKDGDPKNHSNLFFKTHSNIADEIKIPDSIFIFHDINSIYFLFQERETEQHNHTYKSILKIDNRENEHKTTKKVRIQDKIKFSQPMKNKYTRKFKP